MASLNNIEKSKFEKLFGMNTGYVLDFSNRTFQIFILDCTGINIEDTKYDNGSNSKANRLRAFWSIESDTIVADLTKAMLEYYKELKNVDLVDELTPYEKKLYNDCLLINKRLNNSNNINIVNSRTKIFICYSKRDMDSLMELRKHLTPLQRNGNIDVFYDDLIQAGDNWSVVLNNALNDADIILLLVSADFLNSDYIYNIELPRALERHSEGTACVIPIILRSCNWQATSIGILQAVPSNGSPILYAENRDEVYVQVVEAVLYAIEDKVTKSKNFISNSKISAGGDVRIGDITQPYFENDRFDKNTLFDINEVFPKSGIPVVTFVEPFVFKKLISSIKHKGRGIIIEGPSGIGKTTAIKTAIKQLKIGDNDCLYLSARNPENIEKIGSISKWHSNIVIIDDFHRLEENTKKVLADYMRYLADVEIDSKKLIIIGISNTGTKLISFGYDLATRIDVFEFSKVEDDKIIELIERGEQALNIKLMNKGKIITAANGSLSIAQFLCYNSVVQEGIYESQKTLMPIKHIFSEIITIVKTDISRKFNDFISIFSYLGGKHDRTCIALLKAIAESENGSINLDKLQRNNTNLAQKIENILENKLLEQFFEKEKDYNDFLFFDKRRNELVIDDPQLIFYINHLSESAMASMSGKRDLLIRDKVFISYSHRDEEFLNRVLVHLKPFLRDTNVEVWSDKKIQAGDLWRKEIQKALEVTKVAILLVSADFLASDFIISDELPDLIKASKNEGSTLLSLFVKPVNLDRFKDITQYQGINSPSATLIDLSSDAEREKIYVKLSQKVEGIYKNEIPL